MSSLVMSHMDGLWTTESSCSKELFSSSAKLDGRFQMRGSANIRTATVKQTQKINEHQGGRLESYDAVLDLHLVWSRARTLWL